MPSCSNAAISHATYRNLAITAAVITVLVLTVTAIALATLVSAPAAALFGAGFAAVAIFVGPTGGACAALGIVGVVAFAIKSVSTRRPLTSAPSNIQSAVETPSKEDYRAMIIKGSGAHLALSPDEIKSRYNASQKIACDHIFGNLYLGNSAAFAEATHLTWTDTSTPRGELFSMTNEKEFETIITVCPMQAITHFANKYSTDDTKLESSIKNDFSEHGIAWHPVGKTINDEAGDWMPLVAACSPNLHDVDETNVDQWFEPTFKILDQAVFGEVKTLVHCQAGQSRSATLLAAYLINRFNVSTEEAHAFLCNQRPYVKSQFREPLKTYETKLNSSPSRQVLDSTV